jgi:hypothetical protein
MEIAALIFGLLVIGGTLVDALWTTVYSQGAGPLTSGICRLLWAAGRRTPNSIRHRVLSLTGPTALLLIILAWVLLLWLGWWLVFSGSANAVHEAKSGLPADAVERIYFAGFTVFTLGVGDYVPGGPGWRVATAAASFCGLFLVTLSITYLLSALSAATQKRQLSKMLHRLGRTPQQIVRNAWQGGGFSGLRHRLDALWPLIELHTQRHLAYPIIHYFRGSDRQATLAIGIAVLDESLWLLREAVSDEHRPDRWQLQLVDRALADLLQLLDSQFIAPAEHAPPLPELDGLNPVPIADDAGERLADSARHRSARRRRLLGLVRDAGWDWADVLDSPFPQRC